MIYRLKSNSILMVSITKITRYKRYHIELQTNSKWTSPKKLRLKYLWKNVYEDTTQHTLERCSLILTYVLIKLWTYQDYRRRSLASSRGTMVKSKIVEGDSLLLRICYVTEGDGVFFKKTYNFFKKLQNKK